MGLKPQLSQQTKKEHKDKGQRKHGERRGEIQGETVSFSAIGGVDLDPLEAHVALSPILRKRRGEESVAIRDNLGGDKNGGTNEGTENPTSPVPTQFFGTWLPVCARSHGALVALCSTPRSV